MMFALSFFIVLVLFCEVKGEIIRELELLLLSMSLELSMSDLIAVMSAAGLLLELIKCLSF